jgi:hypothetical protein
MAGPEVPFPLMFPMEDKALIEIAEKLGFCKDCPFPMKTDPKEHTLAGQKLKRELGAGAYTANEIAGVVTIGASGVAPNLNTIVQLVQLPLMIWPPRFALFFTTPEITLPAIHPFKVEATMMTPQRLEAIQVQDRDGLHSVPVQNF